MVKSYVSVIFSGYRPHSEEIKVSYESFHPDESNDMHIDYILRKKISGHELWDIPIPIQYHIRLPSAGAVLGHVGDIVQAVRVSPACETATQSISVCPPLTSFLCILWIRIFSIEFMKKIGTATYLKPDNLNKKIYFFFII